MNGHSVRFAFGSGVVAWVVFGSLLCAPLYGQAGKPFKHTGPGIDGYCPVSYFSGGKPVKGSPEHTATFMGRQYYLSSAEAKTAFERDPLKYLPQYSGLCTTALGGSYGNRFAGDPEVYYIIEGKLYLFSSMRARNAFDKNPPLFIRQGNERFVGLSGYCPVAYQRDNKAIKGDLKLQLPYGEYAYAFVDEDARKAFIADPERYVPMYNLYATMAISQNKRYPADPKYFRVVNQKTYLFWDEAARKQFDADPEGIIRKADEKWKILKDM